MRRAFAPSLIAVLLLLAGCGGGSSDAGSTTSPGAKESTKAPTASVTTAQLEALLPAASAIGPDYTLNPVSDGDPTTSDPTGSALETACPEAAALDIGGTGANTDDATASFSAPDDRGIEISLDPTPVGFEEDAIPEVVDAFNACTDVSLEESGTAMTLSMSAAELEGHGDFGIEVGLSLAFEADGAPVSIDYRGYVFVVDGVGISVLATSGFDPETMQAIPGEDDLLAPLADELEKRVRAL